MTDNKARTAAKVKNAIGPLGGTLTRVLYQFVKKGVIVMKCNRPVDDVLDELIEAGVEDVHYGEEGIARVIPQFITMTLRRLSTTMT
jgi:transcriptional/translational regulatory protein YebC/TACO1